MGPMCDCGLKAWQEDAPRSCKGYMPMASATMKRWGGKNDAQPDLNYYSFLVVVEVVAFYSLQDRGLFLFRPIGPELQIRSAC